MGSNVKETTITPATEVEVKKVSRRGRPRKESISAGEKKTETPSTGKEKGQKEKRVRNTMFQRVPARPDFDPENPVIMYVRVDNTLERLDVQGWEPSQDKIYITQRRGMVVNTITIPLSRISFIQTWRFVSQIPTAPAHIAEAEGLAQVSPNNAPKDYVVDPKKAMSHFARDAKKIRKDYYEKEDIEEAPPPDNGTVTGATLLDKGFNHVG